MPSGLFWKRISLKKTTVFNRIWFSSHFKKLFQKHRIINSFNQIWFSSHLKKVFQKHRIMRKCKSVFLVASWIQGFMVCLALEELSITTDKSALLSLKSHVSFDPKQALENWSSSGSVCSWTGITCGNRHQRVTALNISSLGLIGSIPPDFGNLSFLISLDISNNLFHGNLPEELADLHRLQYMNANLNNLTGEIPAWFALLPNLQHLFLAYNAFSGLISPAICNATNLETLVLGFNSLEGNIPEEIGNLSKLQWLSLGNNMLTGSMPESLFISSLRRLVLTNNSLSGNLPMDICSHLPNLEVLAVSVNELEGQIPTGIGSCSRIQIMSLSHNKLSGTIPRQIGNLTQLTNLYLGNNNLEGEIPPEIGNLPLELLSLENSGLSGMLPSSIYNITTLTWINLYNNKLSGSLSPYMCTYLPSVGFIDLGSNRFTGNIPRGIGNCTFLTNFYLSSNQFTGEVPMEIGNLVNMDRLALDNNNFTGLIPSKVFNITGIRGISLLGNSFSGSLPENIGIGLPNLEELYLGINNFSGAIPDSISNASKLTRLGLGYNQFTGSIPQSIGDLGMLQYLNVISNNLTTEASSPELKFLDALTKCRQLLQLWIGYNPMNGFLPVSIGNLSNSLEYVYAANCGIKGQIPNQITNLSSLSFLFLQGNDLTGSIPDNIAELSKLQAFNVYDNKMEGLVPNGVCNLNNLGFLSLSYNKFSGSVPACLGNVTSLRYIYMSSNIFSSSLPTSLFSLNDLLHLDLSENFLNGSLPSEIGSLKAATLLNISRNQISGVIPSTIEGLQNIIDLNFSFNKLEGSIPESIGNLSALETLDLSNNNLSGAIPNSLQTLSHLSYFNVSFNRLSGEIPGGGPFRNFTYESFMSNEALCGAPRLQVPACRAISSHRPWKRRVMLIVLIPAAVFFAVLASVILLLRFRKTESILDQGNLSNRMAHGRVTYHELQQATDGFSPSNLIGTGGYGSVYKASLGESLVAVKVFNLQLEGAFRSFDTECEVLRNLRHRNLNKVISSCSSPDFKALVLEYMPNGSLEKWLHSDDLFIDFSQRLDVMIDVASALDYLHHGYSIPVVHCDLKPSNILLDGGMVAHVSDFGIAKLLGLGENVAQTQNLATIGYMAPEYGLEGLISTRSDIYSFGIMLMETFTRKKPTDGMFSEDLNLKEWIRESWPNAVSEIIDADLIQIEGHNSKGMIQCISAIMELALKCCSESPEDRIQIGEVLSSLEKIRVRLLRHQ